MKYVKLLKIRLLFTVLAFSAGIFVLCCGFFSRIPKDVTIYGVEVGGLSRAEAVRAVRESIERSLKDHPLTIYGHSEKYVFTTPEIGYSDNLRELVKKVKKGKSYPADVRFFLNDAAGITAAICADESVPAVEPYARFNAEGEPFTYFDGADGTRANRLKLLSDVRASLDGGIRNGGFRDVYVSFQPVNRHTSVGEVRYNTRMLSTFTTYYDGENAARSHNIRLAVQKINGCVLENGEEFSFNRTVGARTAARGFRKAKIIERGEFVEGIGGGVCQVSTTLFNAALLSGCHISEYHAHSLAVSYVPPSFDAMVSGNDFDLKFVNDTGYPLYIRARTGFDSVTFDIYGRGDGAQYGYSSVVSGSIPAPVETTEDLSQVKVGKDGVVSAGYLTVTRNGMTSTSLFRRDKYAPVKNVVLSSSAPLPDGTEQTAQGEENDG